MPPPPPPIDELGNARARIATLETAQTDLQNKLRDAQVAVGRSDAVAQAAQQRLDQTTAQLSTTQQALVQAQGEIGRLRAISDTVDALKAERDRATAQLAQVRADANTQVVEAVKAALAQVNADHAAAAADWTKEREGLRGQIADLQQKVGQPLKATETTPVDLATKFAQVLSSLAEGHAEPGQPYAAALTSLEVEARGVLQASAAADAPPRFVTVEPGATIEPAQLSTIKMSFKLLPRSTPGS